MCIHVATIGPGKSILSFGVLVYFRNAYEPLQKTNPGISILDPGFLVYFRNAYTRFKNWPME